MQTELTAAERRWYLEHKNVIPPMVHPLSSGWRQPSSSAIEIDDKHALMSRKTFEELLDYSMSMPTGAYEGKMWKRQYGCWEYGRWKPEEPEMWQLCWYGVDADETQVSGNCRKILVV